MIRRPAPLPVLAATLGLVVSVAVARPARADEPDPTLDAALRGSWVEKAGVHVRGWIEASVSTTPTTAGDTRAGRVFDVEADGLRLHQAYFAIEKAPSGPCFDVGGKVAVLYGTDARFLHAHGLLDDQHGREQFDLLEAYLSAHVPIGRGFDLQAGKCATPMGFEVIEAANDLLPSRSFLFGFAIPFTHTGLLATFALNADTTMKYGLFFGWDVWDDTNDSLSQLLSFSWTSPSKRDGLTFTGIVGPEKAGNDRDLRTVVDATWTHTWSDPFKTALNADVGFEERSAPSGGTAAWYGVAAYGTYAFCGSLSGTVRAEWFEDRDGTRLGTAARLFEATVGLDWAPIGSLPTLYLRPEVRWDHSFDGAFFDGGADRDQLSLSLDLLFRF